jgi:hypothetical protein
MAKLTAGPEVRLTPGERLAQIAGLVRPCRAPDIAGGFDTCSHGEAWPCEQTRAHWLAAGQDERAEVDKVLATAKLEQEAEQAGYEALCDEDPAAARRYAMRGLHS